MIKKLGWNPDKSVAAICTGAFLEQQPAKAGAMALQALKL